MLMHLEHTECLGKILLIAEEIGVDGEGFYDYEGNYIRWGIRIRIVVEHIEDGEKTLLMGQEIGYVCK